MAKLFNAEVANQIKEILGQMKNEITMKLFIDGTCDTCLETKQLLEETSELSDKIKVVVYETKKDVEEAKKYNVTLTPTFVLLDSNGDYKGVRFSGFPGGHEINSYLTAILEMSGHTPEFPADVLARIGNITKPIDIKVFVTMSCPHCPGAVETAHRLSMLNSNVTGTMIEAQTFHEMSNEYKVSGVPKIVINDKYELVGNQPVEEFLKKIEAI